MAEQSGTCGENAAWVLDDDGTLTISGTGEIVASSFSSLPVTRVVIENGITSIGSSAFYGCGYMTSITLPDTLTSIESGAFIFCTSLTNLTIPEGVTTIGNQAIYHCDSLISVSFPDSLTSIGFYNLYLCDRVRYKYANIDTVGAKYMSSARSFRIPGGKFDLQYQSDKLGIVGADKDITELVIPDRVTSIGNSAFEGCTKLTSVALPDTVTAIGSRAFAGCTGLIDITLPDGLTAINSSTFAGCTSLTGIDIPDSVTTIGGQAFYGCVNLVSVTIPDGLSHMYDGVFTNCASLTGFTIPNGMTSIPRMTFYNCTSLTSVTIPDSVTNICGYAFSGCAGLTGVSLPEGVTDIGEAAFHSCASLKSIRIPDSVTSIGISSFYNCSSLTSVTLPAGLTSIPNYAFSHCFDLTGLTIPDSVASIGRLAFEGCVSLTSLTVPDSVTSIDGDAFGFSTGMGCTSLKKIYISENLSGFSSITLVHDATVYCREFSPADYWATDMGYAVVYVDDLPAGAQRTVTLPESLRLARGETARVTASVFPSSGAPAVAWRSSNSAVAAISQDGTLTALSAGQTTITAAAGEASAAMRVTVYVRAESFTISGSATMHVGETLQLAAGNISPRGAEFGKVIWKSRNSAVASVDENGRVYGLEQGSTVIFAAWNGIVRECRVEVRPVGFIIPAEAWVAAKDTLQITSVAELEGLALPFSWSCADTSLAVIDQNGLVRGLKPGETSITVSANGITRECALHVCYPVRSVYFPEDEIYVAQGRRIQADAYVTDRAGASFVNKLVTFTSSDENIAVVNAEGRVTGVSTGTAVITAASASGIQDAFVIVVTPAGPMRRLVLPASLNAIEAEAFRGDGALEEVFIPAGCASIGEYAFADCSELLAVHIPMGTTVAANAFDGCNQLTIYCPEGSAAMEFAVRNRIDYVIE